MTEAKTLLIIDRQRWIGVVVPWALGKELVPNSLQFAAKLLDDA
jgi:hypothetical protein